jgi:hypothetical protein
MTSLKIVTPTLFYYNGDIEHVEPIKIQEPFEWSMWYPVVPKAMAATPSLKPPRLED